MLDNRFIHTLASGVRKSEGQDGPPSHGLFDNHANVGQPAVVRPQRRPVLADDGVDLGLCLGLHVRELDHGLDEGEDHGRVRLRPPLDQRAAQEVELVARELERVLLVQDAVEEGALAAGVEASLHDALDQSAVEAVHELSHVVGA